MEKISKPIEPEISLVIVTPDRYQTIRNTIKHFRSQNKRERLEIVIVTPSKADFHLDESEIKNFFHVQIVETGPILSAAKARAKGVHHAHAPIVAFIEDHVYPGPEWVQALIEAHRKPWAVVGPVIKNANPDSRISWMNLLIEYGPWLDPKPPGMVDHLPGHNSSYKRKVLLDYGPDLERMLEAETLLHWDLRTRGYQIYLEPRAKTYHINFSSFFPSVTLRFDSGRLFASQRSLHWSLFRRLSYSLGSPLIPMVRLFRIFRELSQYGKPPNLPRGLLPYLLLGLILDGFGEMVGYLFGTGDSIKRLTDRESHRYRFLNQSDRKKMVER